MLKMFLHKAPAEIKIFKFPAGESGVSFHVPNVRTHIYNPNDVDCHITLNWEGNDDLINLALLVDAVRREHWNHVKIALTIPYFPYCRQDRPCNKGESLSVKVIADFINSLKFERVFVNDPHSDVLGAVLNNMIEIDNCFHVCHAVNHIWGKSKAAGDSVALVSPDAGALKKTFKYAKYCDGIPVIRADKSRDVMSGKITGTVMYSEHLGNVDLLVVDDICDGGYTFTQLAPELRKITNGTVNLFVTHGIFTKGVDIVADVYDNVFVVNRMCAAHAKLIEI